MSRETLGKLRPVPRRWIVFGLSGLLLLLVGLQWKSLWELIRLERRPVRMTSRYPAAGEIRNYKPEIALWVDWNFIGPAVPHFERFLHLRSGVDVAGWEWIPRWGERRAVERIRLWHVETGEIYLDGVSTAEEFEAVEWTRGGARLVTPDPRPDSAISGRWLPRPLEGFPAPWVDLGLSFDEWWARVER